MLTFTDYQLFKNYFIFIYHEITVIYCKRLLYKDINISSVGRIITYLSLLLTQYIAQSSPLSNLTQH